jgi:transcriptional regulator with XRE-family HTH domain
MGRSLIDYALVRRRRAELGLSIRQVAALIGTTGPGYVALENGGGNPDIGLDAASRLASALGLSLDQLVRSQRIGPEHADDEPSLSGDVAALGALLSATGTLTPVGALCEVLDWPLDRFRAAENALSERLAAVGMVLRRSHARLAIERAAGAVDDEQLAKAVRRHLGRVHLSLTEARLLRHVEHGDVPTQPSNPEQVALGVLVNAGLVAPGPAPSKTAEAPLELTDDVRFSLMLEEPEGQGLALKQAIPAR